MKIIFPNFLSFYGILRYVPGPSGGLVLWFPICDIKSLQ